MAFSDCRTASTSFGTNSGTSVGRADPESCVGENQAVERQFLCGELEVVLTGQGHWVRRGWKGPGYRRSSLPPGSGITK
jgi:hypothetical protein